MHTSVLLATFGLLLSTSGARLLPRASGSAILQFEIDQDTFTSDTPIGVPGTITLNQNLIGATIAEVSSSSLDGTSCQAFNGATKVGAPFTLTTFVDFAGGNFAFVETIQCKD